MPRGQPDLPRTSNGVIWQSSRMKSRWNHLSFDWTQSLHKAHTKVSPESTTFHKYITLQSLNLIITNQVRNLWKVLEIRIESSSEFTAAEIKRVLNDDTWCHDEARTWHHSALPSLAGVVSHSTDQPGGKVHGQVKLAIMSSKVSPETKLSHKQGWVY